MEDRKHENEGSRYSVPNLERALKIMELLSYHKEGLIAASIVKELAYPKNSVFRICNTLVNTGYLMYRSNTQQLVLTRKLFAVGYRAISEDNIVQLARGVMRTLRDEFKETVVIGTLMENEGVVLEEMAGLHHFNFRIERGAKFYLHCTAPGKAILAHLSEREQNKLLGTIEMIPFNKNTITDVDALRAQFEKIKSERIAYDYAEQIEGCHCICAPILDQYNYPTAAIWITGPSSRLPFEKYPYYGAQIKKAADSISALLGCALV